MYGTANFSNDLLEFQVEKARFIKRPTVGITIKEQLKQKGLLPKAPKPLPVTINRIAVITSKQSKVVDDFKHTYEEQAQKGASIKVIEVPVEGTQAAHEIANAINRVNNDMDADVIVLIRGGGSETALAPFNSLLVAEAIYHSTIPVVTGIGHQSDKTAADDVADHSKITATAAASYLAQASSAPATTMQEEEPITLKKTQAPQIVLIWGLVLIIVLALVIYFVLQFLSPA